MSDRLGEPYLYINKERWETAQFVSLTVSRSFSDQISELILDDPNYEGEATDSEDINVYIYNMLSNIEACLKEARKTIVFVVVIAYLAGEFFEFLGVVK